MAIYDLYGASSADIDTVRSSLETALNVEFEAHESSYQGQYFQWGKTTGEHFVLKKNEDPIDGEPAEVNFSEEALLLYVNDTPRSEDLCRLIKSTQYFTLLRHEDLA